MVVHAHYEEDRRVRKYYVDSGTVWYTPIQHQQEELVASFTLCQRISTRQRGAIEARQRFARLARPAPIS